MIDHELMQSLEYGGPYGGRYMCKDCVNCPIGEGYRFCEKQGVNVLRSNNVCRSFEARIKNPSAPDFNFDDYLEYLGSDFYRPWSVDTDIIVGHIDRPVFYTHDKRPKIPLYKPYDKPYCRVFMPRCHVEVDGHKFEIDYRLYRELKFVEDGEVLYDLHLWKDKPTQRKYNKEINGRWRLPSVT